MCGIAGIVDFSGRGGDLTPAISRMRAAIAHRGPDDSGAVSLGGPTHRPVVHLAHARLAIIDLSPGGHQPMSAADEQSWIVYNGELYDYRERRAAATRRGRTFRTASDTEVLLDAIDEEGVSALPSLRGMFALAHWDVRRRTLLLARDPFGIKPLYFARPSEGVLAFASEPRAIAAAGLLAVDAALSPASAAEFLERGSIAAARTAWRGLDVVAPGEWVRFDGAALQRERYWRAADVFAGSEREREVAAVASDVEPAIHASVTAHLVSDVPVGIFLSGGLDSTAILAAARRSAPVRTFTITMGDRTIDEAADARVIARRFESDHTELAIRDLDVDATLDEFFAAMQEPTVDGFNTFLVARAAREAGVRVVLSGVGGDELFGGYSSFVVVPRLWRWRHVGWPIVRVAGAVLDRVPSRRAARLSMLARTPFASPADVWWGVRGLFTSDEAAAIAGAAPPDEHRTLHARRGGTFDVIRGLECEEYLERQLLRDADAFTMCRALELRTPFVDRVLAEDVARAGRWRRAPGRSYKRTLFAALPALTSPGQAARPKRGFVLPFDAWLRDALTASRPRCLADAADRLRQPRYRPWIDGFLQHRVHWSSVWALYVLDRYTSTAAGA